MQKNFVTFVLMVAVFPFISADRSAMAAEMEKDPTASLEIAPKLESAAPAPGVRFSLKIPAGMHLNADGPYALQTENFEGADGKKTFAKEVFDFPKKSAFVAGKKMIADSPATAKVVVFVCDDKNTWCRRVVRNVTF